MTTARLRRPLPALIGALIVLGLLAGPAAAAPTPPTAPGSLTQLEGEAGCLVNSGSKGPKSCGSARALKGPGPFMGSQAIAVSPDGKNVYVASSKSDAIAIFSRDKKSGELSQAAGSGGCISNKGNGGCAKAVGLNGPNSVAVSADGKNVYATARDSNAVLSFRRNKKDGSLRPLAGAACYTGLSLPAGCLPALGLLAPDVVAVSADGKNVYVGSFFGNSVASFAREEKRGVLTQLAGSAGCIAEATAGCATGIGLGAVEGLAVSRDGSAVYAASALSNALVELSRNPETGALTQATDGSGCIVDSPLSGCTNGVWIEGANAVATSPGSDVVYVTSLLSNSVTTFAPSTTSAGLRQKEGPAGCMVWLRAVGCSFGRAMRAPEGIAVSPDGFNVYVASFATGAIDVLLRNRESGNIAQKPNAAGCLAPKSVPGCTPARALKGVSSIALSPDGRFVYSTSFGSNAVDIFRREK
ncbi:MAG: lactonase family protein [Solirubrobacterales bacterium]